jgi:hypothetical protein
MTIRLRATLVAAAAWLLASCATQTPVPTRRPADIRAEIRHRLPPGTADREGWAADIEKAFSELRLEADAPHLCAAIAVIGQESGFVVNPVVPGLGRIARAEIDRRAAAHHVPGFVVSAALKLPSSQGGSYGERIAGVRTEHELSLVYDDLIGRVPLGRRLFANSNPVRTAGPMQVGIAFAEDFAREHGYPYPHASIRDEAFTRRGGVYFGVAHLLAYPVSYDRMIYRFADYNAGRYASRNAAFQNAVAIASGSKLALDGDLVGYGDGPGATERAVQALAQTLDLGERETRRALAKSGSIDFERTALYERVFAHAEAIAHRKLPRAIVPDIRLKSPKITRKLTTEWFAKRVDARYRACLAL